MPANGLSVAVFLTLAAGSIPAAPAAMGYHGDGSGVIADGAAPRTWSDDEHVLWKAALPNWGNGQPVACAGAVYVLSEPLGTAPILSCFDADDGTLRWEDEIDHLDDATRRETASLLAEVRRANALQARHFAAVFRGDDDARAAVLEEIGAGDYHTRSTKGPHLVVRPGDRKGYGRRLRDLRQRGAGIPFWCIGGDGDVHHPGYSAWEGTTYAAPVADADGVWIWVMPGVAASYDRDGTRRWMRYLDPFAEGGKKSGRWPDCKYTASPVLVDAVLVVAGDDRIHGLNAADGALLWSTDAAHGQGWEPCPMLAIGLPTGERGVIGHDGVIYRPADGRPLCTELPDPTDAGLIVHGDTVVMQIHERKGRGRRVMAWRLRAASDDRWEAELRWERDDYRLASDHDNRVPICYGGTIYCAAGLVDLADGTLRVESKRKDFFHSHSAAWKVGDLLYCHGPEDKTGRGGPVPPAVTRVCDPQTLEVLAVNRLAPAPIEGPKRDQLMAHSSRGELGWGPRGMQTIFADGRRLYVRSHDHLHCIGAR